MVSKKKVALGVGFGLAAAAAAAGAGYYFYGSKNAAANRKKAAKWANGLKADVLRRAKKLKKLDERAIKTIVAESAKAYEKLQSIDRADLEAAAEELRHNWKNIEREVRRVSAEDRKLAKKIVSRAGKTVRAAVEPKKRAAKKKKS